MKPPKPVVNGKNEQANAYEGDLISRIEELESAVSASLHVNKLLNEEVEKYIKALEFADVGRSTWERRARWLCTRLNGERKQKAAASSDFQEEADSVAALLEQEGQRAEEAEGQSVPSTSGVFQPTAAQEKLIQSLKSKGTACGWLINPVEVHLGPVLGQGMFGTTFLGTWQGAKVAVKVVRVSKVSELTNFLREVEALASLRHPNILPFLGACMTGANQFWIVTEFMEGGTLAAALHPARYAPPQQTAPGTAATAGGLQGVTSIGAGGAGAAPGSQVGAGAGAIGSRGINSQPARPRPFRDRLRWAADVAAGMAALEGLHPVPLLHRDLKPSNVFLDGAGHARIGDFGLSRRLLASAHAELTGETGTYLYMAPEVMRHEVYDGKADVWSWGVLLIEALTLEAPYAHTYLTPVQVACAVAEEQLCPEIPPTISVDLQVIAKLATSFDPMERPTFGLICEELAPVLVSMDSAQKPSGLLTSLSHSITATWGSILGRIYPNIKGEAAAKADAAKASEETAMGAIHPPIDTTAGTAALAAKIKAQALQAQAASGQGS